MLNGKFFSSNNSHQQEKCTHLFKKGIDQPGISSGSIFLLFSYESNWGHIHNSQGKIPGPPALHDSPKAVLLLGEIGSGSLLGHKVTLPEQKDTLFKMLKLVIVKFLSCLRFKTLKTIPCSVAHDSYSFGQIQYRSQLGDQCREFTRRYRCIILLHFISPVWQKCQCCCSFR